MFIPGRYLMLLLPFLLACKGETDPPAFQVEDSAGVTLVTNPGADIPLDWTAEKVLEIAPIADGEEGFFEATSVGVLNDGRLAVLDRMGKKVVLFDEEGQFLVQYGREGSGPGEFQFPMAMTPLPDGGVAVFDAMNRRLERFDEALRPEAALSLQIPYFGGRFGYAGGFLVLPTTDPEVTDLTIQQITAIREPDTIQVVRYQRETSGPIDLESCGLRLRGIPPLFAPNTRWAPGPSNWMAVVGTSRYEVDVYRAPTFELERRVRRILPRIQATRELAEEEVGDAMRVMTPAGERICDAGEVADKRGFASEIPPISDVLVSPAGEIFLERWAPGGEEPAIDILDPDGGYVGTLPPGFPFPQAFLDADRFAVTVEDELELTTVVIYRILR